MVAIDLSTAAAASTVAMPVTYQPLYSQQIIADISWGTPAGASVPTVVDTGSYGFWVAGPNATVNSGSPYLGVHGPCNQTMEPFFDYPASTSHTGPYPNSAVGFAYGGGGKLIQCSRAVNDTMNFAGGHPSIDNIQVAICDFMLIKDRATTCDGAHYDKSIMGLAPIPPVGSGRAPQIHPDLRAQGRLGSDIFSMWFDAPPTDIHEAQMGSLIWGAAPEDKHTGPLVTIRNQGQDRVEKGYYYAAMPQVHGDKNSTAVPRGSVDQAAPDCLVDSGTWGLTLPSDEDAFLAATGLELDSPFINPRYPSPCADIPLDAGFDLVFADKDDTSKTATVRIPFRSLASGEGEKEGTCRLGLQLGDAGCTLGGTFYASAFVVHDDEKQILQIAQGAKAGSAR